MRVWEATVLNCSNHTQGEWVAHLPAGRVSGAARAQVYTHPTAGGPAVLVASVETTADLKDEGKAGFTDATRDANALLIADAPRMLQLVARFADVLRELHFADEGAERVRADLCEAAAKCIKRHVPSTAEVNQAVGVVMETEPERALAVDFNTVEVERAARLLADVRADQWEKSKNPPATVEEAKEHAALALVSLTDVQKLLLLRAVQMLAATSTLDAARAGADLVRHGGPAHMLNAAADGLTAVLVNAIMGTNFAASDAAKWHAAPF